MFLSGLTDLLISKIIHMIQIFDSVSLGANVLSSRAVRRMAEATDADFAMLCLGDRLPRFHDGALQRMEEVMRSTGCNMLYCDCFDNGVVVRRIPYQSGSVRDDFDFGRVILFSAEALRRAAATMTGDYAAAGLYDLRLRLTEQGRLPFYLPEPLYTVARCEEAEGESQFDYVDPRNEASQAEMQEVFTAHLRRIGAWIEPVRTPVVDTALYPVEASVIIPVRNREATIADAVRSALSQQTDFPFNVIVVDNYSTDGTAERLRECATERVVTLTPPEPDYGIGGCWNLALNHPSCGRYAVQLDSDDLYSSPHTLSRIVAKFREEGCAIVVGSYTLCDFDLNTLPPGLIAHREWTDSNGPNNALRVNGFGAPRAFLTSVARRHPMPDVSYGEDYAMGLRLSRSYRIGRIFDSLYLCRRWGGNSDASLTPELANRYNTYKDTLRNIELEARIKENHDSRR